MRFRRVGRRTDTFGRQDPLSAMRRGVVRSWNQPDHPYAQRTAVLATKHGKLPLIAPPLMQTIGLQLRAIDVDTDTLGSFSGEIPRKGTPLETAISKARMGMRAASEALGIASEGSISPDPSAPFVMADREIIVLVDDDAGIVIWESHLSWEIVTQSQSLGSDEPLDALLSRAGFPSHRLIVRPNSGALSPIYKGIERREQLVAAIAECAATSPDGKARVESDLRAHMSPSRQKIIAQTAEIFARRLAERCSKCGAPGWGRVDVVVGIPCAWCGTDIARPRAEVDGCVSCEARVVRELVAPQLRADPAECPMCNP